MKRWQHNRVLLAAGALAVLCVAAVGLAVVLAPRTAVAQSGGGSCSFSAATPGTMTVNTNWTTMSTENPGGVRPGIEVTNTGSVLFTFVANFASWQRNGTSIDSQITPYYMLKTSASGHTNAVDPNTLWANYPTSGTRTVFLEATATGMPTPINNGTSTITPFMTSGNYAVTMLVACF